MSHRVTTETEIKDLALAKQACKTAGISFTESGKSLYFTSGSLNRAMLDLTTGRISGDTDYGHTSEGLGALRQAYGEAKYRAECLKQGISIESRETDSNGNVILMCAMG